MPQNKEKKAVQVYSSPEGIREQDFDALCQYCMRTDRKFLEPFFKYLLD